MKYLFLIPARGGSKGIPHKNIKPLNGIPLIYYAIDNAREFASDRDICVSTDDDEIINVVEKYDLKVSFKRPDNLATDKCGTYEVILNAIDYYLKKDINYDAVVLLQTTSPFRRSQDIKNCLDKFEKGDYDMVVSVKEATTNPFYNCFISEDNNYLKRIIPAKDIHRRQDASTAYEYNGAVYIIRANVLRKMRLEKFSKIGYIEMDEIHSLDLDTMIDWKFAEMIINENLLNYGE